MYGKNYFLTIDVGTVNLAYCLTEQDYNFLKEFFEVTRGAVVPTTQYRLNQIYTNVFNKNAEFTSCGSCLLDRINELKKIYDSYVQENEIN